MSNPYLNKKIIPLRKEPLPLPFSPGRYESYLWLDLHELIKEYDQRIADFEADPMHKQHKNALMCVPMQAGSVFGINAAMLLEKVVDEVFHYGNNYDLSVVEYYLNGIFDTDIDDPDYEYWNEVTAQFFSITTNMSKDIVGKFFTLLGENSFRKACNDDLRWQFLGIYNNQALLGFGLLDYSQVS